MTEQEQQIALFEWMGWTNINATGIFPVGMDPKIDGPAVAKVRRLPDITLDVLHEMEMKLRPTRIGPESSPLWESYIFHLSHVVLPNDSLVHATAAQRREALCRTLFPGKFK